MYDEAIEKILSENNGVIRTADVVAAGIAKDLFYKYVTKAELEKVAHGIYVSPDVFVDEMYLVQTQFEKTVYSHEAALYLHELSEREPIPLTVTVRSSYNSGGLVQKGIKVYYAKTDLYEMGVCEVTTPNGNSVRTYNMERTICDIVRKRSEMDIAVFSYAVKEYVKRKDKNLVRLSEYAAKMKVERQVRDLIELLQ